MTHLHKGGICTANYLKSLYALLIFFTTHYDLPCCSRRNILFGLLPMAFSEKAIKNRKHKNHGSFKNCDRLRARKITVITINREYLKLIVDRASSKNAMAIPIIPNAPYLIIILGQELEVCTCVEFPNPTSS